jgi:predicted unusual protein kinase regulating ubiquinone biosynthesis (AarF/ABC1/UbiB family)
MSEKSQDKIPTSKVQRAAKILTTGAKVGGNYIKYYAKKSVNPALSKDSLHSDNATDIYSTLSELKGSALKVAQMMSMDNQVLPKAYQDKFAMAQFNAPPLSYPLIVKTFKNYFNQTPEELFDTFTKNAVNAASIGQVHQAELNGKQLAVKVQYPGVANSISSDLKLVKPLAAQLFNMKKSELDVYLTEVESKLIEETDYQLELKRSQEIAEACRELEGLIFPSFYPELSSKQILTMDWIAGIPFSSFTSQENQKEIRDSIGQALWNFFLFQMRDLRKVHADPHPGNFLITSDYRIGVLDFGCVKEIPDDFANSYFQLLEPEIMKDSARLEKLYHDMDFFKESDTPAERKKLKHIYERMIEVLARPFHSNSFDFSDVGYFQEIAQMGDEFSKDKELRKMNNARGSQHAIYIFRTFFGLYNLLHHLKAEVSLEYPLMKARYTKKITF